MNYYAIVKIIISGQENLYLLDAQLKNEEGRYLITFVKDIDGLQFAFEIVSDEEVALYRKGEISGDMYFLSGRKTRNVLSCEYGNINYFILTHSIKIERTEREFLLKINYESINLGNDGESEIELLLQKQ